MSRPYLPYLSSLIFSVVYNNRRPGPLPARSVTYPFCLLLFALRLPCVYCFPCHTLLGSVILCSLLGCYRLAQPPLYSI
jgi:hypothetical protein